MKSAPTPEPFSTALPRCSVWNGRALLAGAGTTSATQFSRGSSPLTAEHQASQHQPRSPQTAGYAPTVNFRTLNPCPQRVSPP